MKKIYLFLFMLFVSILSFSAKEDIFGKWITEKASNGNQIIVEFYENNGKINGRIFKLTRRYDENGNLKKDVNNSDKNKRNRTLEGIDFVYGFTYNESNSNYEKGKIYNPEDGKTYDSYMIIEGNGKLKVRGHIPGLSFIGKTQYWSRY